MSQSFRDAYIVSAVRTPLGRFGGALKDLSAVDLGGHAMRAALDKAGLTGAELEGYIFGNVISGGLGQHVARQAAFKAAIPDNVDGYHVNMVCSSGMVAVMNAATHIRGGVGDIFLAGGTESMSQAGYFLDSRARWGYKLVFGSAGAPLRDMLVHDGLTDPSTGEGMGDQTERLAKEYGITREELDRVACESHRRAAAATENGDLLKEIAPITIKVRKGDTVVDRDEGIRADTTMESLARLAPAFSKDGVLTAGNASQITDGAAALVIASGDAVKAHGWKPLARLLAGTWSAGPGWRFAEAPAPGVQKLLGRLGMQASDIDLYENNEAFSINSVLFERLMGVPQDKLNVHGGAVALGHPIGASGARIIVTLLHALQAQDKTTGIATLCHGMGGSTAIAIERMV